MKSRNIRNTTIISDLILFNAAFAFAYVVRYVWQWFLPVEDQFFEPYGRYFSQQIAFNALMILTFVQGRVWRRRRGEFWIDEVSRIGFATATAVTLLMAVTYFFISEAPFSRLMLFWVLLFTVLFLGLARLLRRWILSVLYGRGTAVDRVLVLGSGETGRGLIRTLLARPDLGFKAIGYLHDGSQENNIGLGRIPYLGTFADLPRVLRESPNLYTVFIAVPGEMYRQTMHLLRVCQEHGISAQVVPDLLQLSLNRVEFNNMAGIPMLGVREVGMSRWQRVLKRALDLLVITIVGIPALLLTGIITIAIKLDSPGPVFYAADRVGRSGKLFKMYKFRSMVVDADKRKKELAAFNEADGPIFKIKDDPRLTRVGRFLRRSSLDELPQLWNVLRGQMSLVGPRPPLQEEVDQYKPWHRQRLAVIGGLTGLWQVSGRSDLTFDELCLLDIYYIENWSLAMDIRILLQTVPHSLFGRGAY
jgi:exopolysaccharide biosynthesis polyprenyl glycosylphosphotransferase